MEAGWLPGRGEVWGSWQPFMPTAQCLNCLHSFAFPGDLPPCPVFLMRFPLRSGWRKGSMWITAVFTRAYHAKAWSPLWCGGCRELQAMHKGGVCVLTALIERQKSPFTRPWPSPLLTACCTTRNTKLTQKRARTRSSIRLKETWQFEQSDNPRNGYRFQVGGIGTASRTSMSSSTTGQRTGLALSPLLCVCPKDQTAQLISSWETSLAIAEPLRVSRLSFGPFFSIKLTRSFNPSHVKWLSGSPSRFYFSSFSFSPFCG